MRCYLIDSMRMSNDYLYVTLLLMIVCPFTKLLFKNNLLARKLLIDSI